LLIGRAECGEQFAILAAVECYDDDQLRALLAGQDIVGRGAEPVVDYVFRTSA
jgi:hypothetical protein